MEAFSQGGLIELWYEKSYEWYYGKQFEEPSDVINTYEDMDGIMRAVGHFCEYNPVCNILFHQLVSLTIDTPLSVRFSKLQEQEGIYKCHTARKKKLGNVSVIFDYDCKLNT